MSEIELLSATDYALKELTIIDGNDKKWDFTGLFMEIAIYENLFKSGVTGTVKVADGLGIIEQMPIIGEEKIKIVLKKTSEDHKLEVNGFIYKISDKTKMSGRSQKASLYTINFASAELFKNMHKRIQKTFKKKKISEIVKILLNDLVKDKKIDVQDTNGEYNITIPNYFSLNAINFLSNKAYAIGKNADILDTCFLLFENSEGWHWKSLDKIISDGKQKFDKDIDVIHYEHQTSKNNAGDSGKEKYFYASSLDIVNSFDTLKNLFGGYYGSKLVTFDPITMEYNVKEFSVDDVFDSIEHVDENGKKPYRKPNVQYDSTVHLLNTNKGQTESEFCKTKIDNPVPSKVEDFFQKRASQIIRTIGLYSVAITIPGSDIRKIGDIVELKLPREIIAADPNNRYSKYYQGKYLISEVAHIITKTEYNTRLKLVKDCFNKEVE